MNMTIQLANNNSIEIRHNGLRFSVALINKYNTAIKTRYTTDRKELSKLVNSLK